MNKYLKKALSLIAALGFYGLLIYALVILYPARDTFDISVLLDGEYPSFIIDGFIATIYISILSLIGSLILGFILYLMVSSKIDALKYIGVIFSETVFGSPLIVFVALVYYGFWIHLPFESRLYGGVVALTLYMTPYMKNLFESAISTIDELQFQAMTVFGFTKFQQYRYIIIPQVIRVIIPPLIGNLTFVIKGSTLLNFIGVAELFNQVTFVQYDNYKVIEGYILMAGLYLLITIPLIRITKFFEKRVASWT